MLRVEVGSAVMNLTDESLTTGNTSIAVSVSQESAQIDDLATHGDVL